MRPAFSDWGIRKRVLWLTIGPLLVLTTVLTGYSISSRLSEAVVYFEQRGETLVNAYAGSAEFGLFAGNLELLTSLARTALKEDSVVGVVIEDETGRLLIREGQVPADFSKRRSAYANGRKQRQLNQLWLFSREVLSEGIEVSDLPVADLETGDAMSELLLGRVTLVLNPQPIRGLQQEMVTDSLVIALTGFFIVMLLSYRFANRIVRPVREIIDVVDRLEQQQLDARILGEDAGGDVGRLQTGINAMASRLEDARRELEQRVADATAELRQTLNLLEGQNADLHEARLNADAANQAKDDFLARMSHELRTPLTAVIGYARLLHKTRLDSKQSGHLRVIDQASKLLLSIINDILEFSRIQSGALRLESVPFNLFDTVRDVCGMLELAAQEKHLSLNTEFDPDLPATVMGDPSRLQQILTNLVNNAIKFTERGGITVLVSGQRKADDELLLKLDVVDTGIGISEADQARLFNAFAQADTSISRRFGGFGLGLVITRQLAEMMHGSVELDSVLGRGTTVTCTLRLRLESASLAASAEQDTAAADGRNLLKGKTLLLVEDNKMNRDLIAEMLLQTGADVIRAEGGEAALARLLETRVDVVVMDVHMPDMDGIETMRRIRHLPESVNRVTVIALTANLLSGEQEALQELGVEHILYKPVDEPYLTRLLQELCLGASDESSVVTAVSVSEETINQVLQEVRERLGRILSSGERMSMQELREETHQIRGLVGLFKLQELLEPATRLDQLAIDGDRQACLEQAQQLCSNSDR